MKRVDLRLPLSIALGMAGTNVCAQTATIELHDQISGPAVHTHSAQLLLDGSIVFEEYNITSHKDRETDGTSTLCKVSPAIVRSRITQALALASALPPVVDPERPKAIDGPYRVITIRNGTHVVRSTLSDYDTAESPDALRFLDAWQKLERLVSCHGPNNSFKSNPLRGSA